jgi:hypothetical protein
MGQPKRVQFPLLGINKGRVTSQQPFMTAPRMSNARLYDVLDGRARGGQRPGLTPWGDGVQVGAADNPVVAMCVVSSIV